MRRCLQCNFEWDRQTWHCDTCGWAPPEPAGYPTFAPHLAEDEAQVEDSLFEPLSEIEDGSFWFQARSRLILWALDRFFPTAESLMEVGCGTGSVLAAVSARRPQLRLTGTQIRPESFRFAAARAPAANLVQMDARHIPFRGEFDVIGAFDVIEHIDEDQDVLNEFARALRPGGGIILTVPQHQFLWGVADDHAHHKRRYIRGELIRKTVHAGFEVSRVTSFVSLLLPAMMAARAVVKRSEEFDPLAAHRSRGLAQRIFSAVLTAERTLIRTGVSLPVGGSLLLVAKLR